MTPNVEDDPLDDMDIDKLLEETIDREDVEEMLNRHI